MAEILVRRAQVEDAESIMQVYESPRVIWGTLQLPYPSMDLWKKRLEHNDEHILLVASVNLSDMTQQIVGSLGVHMNPMRPRRKHVASIGMGVRDDWQGKGVGTALLQAAVDMADKWLNILRIELEVYTDNEPAIRLYKKFGFEIEGTLRRHAFRDGEYVDSYFMARLRDEK